MSQSIRMERVLAINAQEDEVPKLKKFEVTITDTNGVEQALRETGLESITRYETLEDGENEEIFDYVASMSDGVKVGLRDRGGSWEFVGYGEYSKVERLSRRFVDLLGAYHTMISLDAQGFNFQVEKNEEPIIIQVC